MMYPKISSWGIIHGKEDHDLIESYLSKPEFRKATPSMTMAYAALKKALNLLPRTIDQQNMGVVVGSSYGELELTEQFLVHLKKNNLARPMIFQNSLHQSILGFLSMMLRSSGPALTVSNRFFSGENALEAGQTLLQSGACETCAVIAVDAYAPSFAPIYEIMYPQGLTIGQGACAMILSDKGPLKVNVSCNQSPVKDQAADSDAITMFGDDTYYDSDGLMRLAKAFEDPTMDHMKLTKPDGSQSLFEIERHSQ